MLRQIRGELNFQGPDSSMVQADVVSLTSDFCCFVKFVQTWMEVTRFMTQRQTKLF